MQERNVTIINKLGLHARAAAKLVTVASTFSCDIEIAKNGQKVNGKSIMGLMMLAAGPGSRLKVHAEGNDASAALTEIEALIAAKFNED